MAQVHVVQRPEGARSMPKPPPFVAPDSIAPDSIAPEDAELRGERAEYYGPTGDEAIHVEAATTREEHAATRSEVFGSIVALALGAALVVLCTIAALLSYDGSSVEPDSNWLLVNPPSSQTDPTLPVRVYRP